MKKRRHIQTRLLMALIGMTAAILLVVGLSFNLSVRGYIRSRVTAQLASVLDSVSFDRRGGDMQGQEPGQGQGQEPGQVQGQPQAQGQGQGQAQTQAQGQTQAQELGQEQGPGQADRHFDRHPDRVIGTTGDAVVLDKRGALATPLYGDRETAAELAAYFSEHGIDESIHYRIISLSSGRYAVSVAKDPKQADCYLVSYADVTVILAFTTRINLLLLAIILVMMLLSVVLSRHFAKDFSRPVQELSDFAREIGGGNLSPREFQFRDIEFDALADSMNHMASELEEAKRKQETFFQNVSHELRTPLTSIRGNAEGIVYQVMEPQAAARVILAESDKLGGMVEDILYLSRMGKAVPEGSAEPADLRELLSLCASEQRLEAQNKGVSFRFDFDEDPVLLPVREQDAQRLFGNLISNAIRYAKSSVLLSCRREGDTAYIAVADDGPGISAEDLPHIFERFYKGKDGKHGIGLALAQSIAESYHGKLSAHNDGGAVFELRFPMPDQI